jgi:hypothetical protein
MRPGDAGYNRAAMDACVEDLTAFGIDVELSWTLSDGFCVVYRYGDGSAGRFGYCARAVPAAEFAEPVEWGEGVAVEMWHEPPPAGPPLIDTHGIGWHGAIEANSPPLPNDL